MTPPPLIELHNRFQALTEEGDSGDETEGEEEIPLPISGGGSSSSSHLSTSTHTGSRVQADGGREPFSDIPQRGGKQSRAKKSPATGLPKIDNRAQVELSQVGPER